MGIVVVALVAIGFFVILNLITASIGWLVAIVIWGIAGAIATSIMGTRTTLLGNILLGMIGGFVGSVTLNLLNIPLGEIRLIGNILVGVVGSVITIAVWRLVNGRRSQTTV